MWHFSKHHTLALYFVCRMQWVTYVMCMRNGGAVGDLELGLMNGGGYMDNLRDENKARVGRSQRNLLGSLQFTESDRKGGTYVEIGHNEFHMNPCKFWWVMKNQTFRWWWWWWWQRRHVHHISYLGTLHSGEMLSAMNVMHPGLYILSIHLSFIFIYNVLYILIVPQFLKWYQNLTK